MHGCTTIRACSHIQSWHQWRLRRLRRHSPKMRKETAEMEDPNTMPMAKYSSILPAVGTLDRDHSEKSTEWNRTEQNRTEQNRTFHALHELHWCRTRRKGCRGWYAPKVAHSRASVFHLTHRCAVPQPSHLQLQSKVVQEVVLCAHAQR